MAYHEAGKLVASWWCDQVFVGFQLLDGEPALSLRNCRDCASTLARCCTREEMVMPEPESHFLSALSYAELAREQEARGFDDFAAYFYRRALERCVARYDEVCARLRDIHEIEDMEPTAELPTPDTWFENVVMSRAVVA